MSIKKRLLIILIALATIIILVIGAILLSSYIQKNNAKKTEIVISSSAGVPLESSPAFTNQGWNKIPNIDKLMEIAAEQDGGEIISVKTIMVSNQIYARVQNASDNGNFNYFFLLSNNAWQITDPDNVPALVKSIIGS